MKKVKSKKAINQENTKKSTTSQAKKPNISSQKQIEKPYYLTQEELDNLEKEAIENLEYWKSLRKKMKEEKGKI